MVLPNPPESGEGRRSYVWTLTIGSAVIALLLLGITVDWGAGLLIAILTVLVAYSIKHSKKRPDSADDA
jgi:hypothetical protein